MIMNNLIVVVEENFKFFEFKGDNIKLELLHFLLTLNHTQHDTHTKTILLDYEKWFKNKHK
jgi:hypothetical protein